MKARKLIADIRTLSRSGTPEKADELAERARTVLKGDPDDYPMQDWQLLVEFVREPHKNLPVRRTPSQKSQTAPEAIRRPKRSVRPEPEPDTSERRPRVQDPQRERRRPTRRAREVQSFRSRNVLHHMGKARSGNAGTPGSSGLPAAQTMPIEQLLEEVERARVSDSRTIRRDVLRNVSYYLAMQRDSGASDPRVRRLKEFRDRPFRGIGEDHAPSAPRVTLPRTSATDHPSPKSAEEELPATKPAHKPTPADLADRIKESNLVHRPPAYATKEAAQSRFERDLEHHRRYQTFLTFEQRLHSAVREVLDEWLADKDIWLRLGQTETIAEDSRVVEALAVSAGDYGYERLRIAEGQSGGNFHTEIILAWEQDQAWLWVNVWTEDGRRASPPRFVRTLLEDEGLLARFDEVSERFTVVEDEQETVRLRDYLLDPNRQLPVFIAGTDEILGAPEVEEVFREKAKSWAQDTLGLATFAVLGPDATATLEEEFGDSYAPRRWAIRTYEPDLDLDNVADARRHRFFGTERLAQWDERTVARRLGTVARAIFHTRGLPPQLRTAQHALSQQENLLLLKVPEERRRQTREHFARAESQQAEIGETNLSASEVKNFATLKTLLNVSSVDEDVIISLAESAESRSTENLARIEKRLAHQTSEIDELEFARDYLGEQVEDREQRIMRLEADQEELRRKTGWLQAQLEKLGDPEAAYSGVYENVLPVDPPQNFEDLLEEIVALEDDGVYFTGDESITLDLDTFDTQGLAVHAAWMSLRTLKDYLRAKQGNFFSGNLHQYLANPPSAEFATVSPHQHAARESQTTMGQYGKERFFEVPASVSETGYAEMQAHFKLTRVGGSNAPRMHYLDDSGNSGNIYVGYVGPHLKIASSN